MTNAAILFEPDGYVPSGPKLMGRQAGQVLADRLSDLVSNPILRQQLGAVGRTRAQEVYDWAVVYRQYQSLWGQLGEIRCAAQNDPAQRALLQVAPGRAPSRLDPYRSFGHYPTALIQPQTSVLAAPDVNHAAYERLAGHGLFNYAGKVLPSPELVERLFAVLATDMLSVEGLAQRAGMELGAAVLAVSVLAKMGLVRLIKFEQN